MNRVREGRVKYANPFSGQEYEVSLRPEDVHSIVFWSKNPQPLEPHLPRLEAMGYEFIFHFTITGLPRPFEGLVIPWEEAVLSFRRLSDRYGPKRVLWRFDPIILSDITGTDYFKKSFDNLARRLEGATGRCYFSFVCLYPKVRRNLQRLAFGRGDPPCTTPHHEGAGQSAEQSPVPDWYRARVQDKVRNKTLYLIGTGPGRPYYDPSYPERLSLVKEMVEIAGSYGITLYTCCDEALAVGGVRPAQCVDGELLYELFPDKPKQTKIVATRKGCNCVQSRDIGAYDTCPHGCIYCYANLNHELARKRLDAHDPSSDMLLPVQRQQVAG